MSATVTLELTVPELEAVQGGLAYVTDYGEKPDPPTPAMTADAKVAKALEEVGYGD